MSAADWPLATFAFAQPWMLAWLAAAALPLVVHLWRRRRRTATAWAATELLAAALGARTTRRNRVRGWLLLAVRTAVIVLAVGAVAGPTTAPPGRAADASQPTLTVLVFDASYSMAYRPDRASRFQRARGIARRLVVRSRDGDGFSLIVMRDRPEVVVEGPEFNRDTMLASIDRLGVSREGADVPAALAAAERLIRRARDRFPASPRCEVVLLTDLGRTSWQRPPRPADQPGSATPEQRLLASLAQVAALRLVDVGQAGAENVAVCDVRLASPLPIIGQDLLLEATVQNFGSTPAPRQPVAWSIDGVPAARQSIDIPANAQVAVRTRCRFQVAGAHVAEVHIGPDRLPLDNRRWISLPVKAHLRVLCVGGKQGATRYLVRALRPSRTGPQPILPVAVPDGSLPDQNLADYDCVFLANVSQFTRREAALLSDYVRGGGSLVFFLGDQVRPDRYNQMLRGREAGSAAILPVSLGEVVHDDRSRFDPLDYQHPIVRAFQGGKGSVLLTTPISRYFRLTVPARLSRARVALAFQNGDPAIVETPVGRGRSIVLATAASLASVDPQTHRPWTALPAWPSFLPLVRELLAYATGSRHDRYNVLVSEPLTCATGRAGIATVIEPDGQERPVSSDPAPAHVLLPETRQVGLYVAQRAGGAEQRWAVNLDTRESDLARVDTAALPAELAVDDGRLRRAAGHGGQPIRRWQHELLLAVLGLLLVESALAARFGGRAARAGRRSQFAATI